MKNLLKKTGIIAIICIFAFMAIASGSSPEDDKEISNDAATTDGNDYIDTTIAEQILFEKDDIKVTAKEYVKDSFWGDGIKLLIENNSTKNINVGCDALIVNDFMIFDLFYCDVAAGKKANETLYLSSSELENAGIENVGKIEFDFYATDSETYDRIFEHEFVTLTTSSFENMDTTTDMDAVEIYNGNGIKIMAKAVNEHDFWGSAVVLYIENNRSDNAGISCDDMSINGFMISPMFSSSVYSGKKAIDNITIFESDLEENNIEGIEDVELSFRIYNSDSYNTIAETGPISFSAK